jgi:hypothetical protein
MTKESGSVRSDTGPFAQVPEWLLDAEVSDRAVRLYGILARYADNEGKSFPSKRTLATRVRCSEASVFRATRELEAAGALVIEERFEEASEEGARRQTSNHYVILRRPPVTGDMGAVLTSEQPPVVTGDMPKNESQDEGEPVELALAPKAREYDPLKGTKIDGRNIPWDALVKATQADEQVEAGQLAKALKQIRGFIAPTLPPQSLEAPEATEQHIANHIRSRARLYRDRWPNVELTPLALAKNWSRVLTAQPGADLDTALDAAQRGIDSARRSA